MAWRGADVLEIVVLPADAHTLLGRCGAGVRTLLSTDEHILELNHPSIGKEQGWVIGRNERRTGHNGMPFGAEKSQER